MLRGEFVMTGSGPAILGQAMLADQVEEIDTRFGRVTVDRKQAVFFPNGLLGMPEKVQFCITRLPSEKMAKFRLLQSLDDLSLSFITLPLDVVNPIIDQQDLFQATHDLGFSAEDMAVLLIVTVQRESGVAQLSANARAPLLVNVTKRTATQYVFPHTKYLIRQPLTL